jgi:uncharacterized protein (TIGR03084 family)
LRELIDDLLAEGLALEGLLHPEVSWDVVTTAEGWTVAHQIGHLLATDEAALLACTSPQEFYRLREQSRAEPERFNADTAANAYSARRPSDLRADWRHTRENVAATLMKLDSTTRIPWFGPSMAPKSMATARLMETWAHGHDIATALGCKMARTDRVRHVCDLGVRTRAFSFVNRGLSVPDEAVRVELRAPSGALWSWGDAAAETLLRGSAWDFALVVTRRLHRNDADLMANGASVEQWLAIAQAFAGPAGRPPARRS